MKRAPSLLDGVAGEIRAGRLTLEGAVEQLRRRVRRANEKPLAPIGAAALWRRELLAGIAGQHIDRPSTWHLDNLYRAAVLELQAVDYWRWGQHVAACSTMADAERAMLTRAGESRGPERAA